MSDQSWSGAPDGDSLLRAIEHPVGLVAHDDCWARVFEAERQRLMRLFPDRFVEIAHIGSTQVEGLCAKPIVDLLAGVRSMEDAIALNDPLCANGYASPRELNRSLSDRQFLMRHADGRRTHHLHLVVHGSKAWHDRIDFARRLRDDPGLRERYAALKVGLAARFAQDREAYTAGKSDFIQAAIDAGRGTDRACAPSDLKKEST